MSNDTIQIIGFLVYWAIGISGFIACHTQYRDFSVNDLGRAGMFGLAGPFMWAVYLFDRFEGRIIVRKRKDG